MPTREYWVTSDRVWGMRLAGAAGRLDGRRNSLREMGRHDETNLYEVRRDASQRRRRVECCVKRINSLFEG